MSISNTELFKTKTEGWKKINSVIIVTHCLQQNQLKSEFKKSKF